MQYLQCFIHVLKIFYQNILVEVRNFAYVRHSIVSSVSVCMLYVITYVPFNHSLLCSRGSIVSLLKSFLHYVHNEINQTAMWPTVFSEMKYVRAP